MWRRSAPCRWRQSHGSFRPATAGPRQGLRARRLTGPRRSILARRPSISVRRASGSSSGSDSASSSDSTARPSSSAACSLSRSQSDSARVCSTSMPCRTSRSDGAHARGLLPAIPVPRPNGSVSGQPLPRCPSADRGGERLPHRECRHDSRGHPPPRRGERSPFERLQSALRKAVLLHAFDRARAMHRQFLRGGRRGETSSTRRV